MDKIFLRLAVLALPVLASSCSSIGQERPKKRYDSPAMLIYTVRPGDNLEDIARKSGTTAKQIKKSSGLKSNKVRPGQVIKVLYVPKHYKKPAA